MISHISPTALSKWENDREDFYISYLAKVRPPSVPQTQAMAVGSAFDAYVKSSLHRDLFGDDPKYSLDALLTAQVDKSVLDWAHTAGRHVFNCYKFTGAYDELLVELGQAGGPPPFWFIFAGPVGGGSLSAE